MTRRGPRRRAGVRSAGAQAGRPRRSVGMAGSPRESWCATAAARRATGVPLARGRRAARGRRPRRRSPAPPAAAGRRRRRPGGRPMPITSASATPSASSRRSGPLAAADAGLVRADFLATGTSGAAGRRSRGRPACRPAPRSGAPRAGDQRGADAVGVDRGGGQRGDGVLVQVGGDDDPGVAWRRARRAAARTSARRGSRSPESSRTAPELRAGDLHRGPDGLRPRRRCRPAGSCPGPATSTCAWKASRSSSCSRVKACARGAGGRDAVAAPGLQVAGGGEAGDVGGPGGGDRRPARGCAASPSRCRAGRPRRRSSGRRPRRSRSRG